MRTALSLATRAPSVHNSQPWVWRIGDRSVHLYSDADRVLPHTDPDQRDLLLSCGICLHHALVALSALGWRGRVTRLPNAADPSHLAALELSRCAPTELDVALAAAIPLRRSDRRLFSSWPVSASDVGLIGARVAQRGVRLRRIELTPDVRRILSTAARSHGTDREYLSELAAWSGRHASTAGVPARNTPRSIDAAGPDRPFTGGQLDQPPGARAEDDRGVLLVLGTDADDAAARLRAGEATSLALLTATSQGLASCPLTEPLEIADARKALRASVFDGDEYPQMLLRVGWAPVNADPLPATPRRPIDEVASYFDYTGAPARD